MGNVNSYGMQMICNTDISTLGIGLHDYHCIGSTMTCVKETRAGTQTAMLSFADTTIVGGGVAANGVVTVGRCEIMEREPLTQRPFVMELEATYSGVLEWIDEAGIPTTRKFDGALHLPVIYGTWDTTVTEYLERACVGGRMYEEAS